MKNLRFKTDNGPVNSADLVHIFASSFHFIDSLIHCKHVVMNILRVLQLPFAHNISEVITEK